MKPFEKPVNNNYGAPMGRYCDKEDLFKGRKTHLCRVPLVDYDYDRGGAYWGRAEPLWCAWSDAIDDHEFIVTYLRAPTRNEAKTKLPGAKFYR